MRDHAQRPNLRLYSVDTGLIECADYATFSPSAGANVHYDVPVRSYLVVHPQGTLVWDTGIEDVIAELPDDKQIVARGRDRLAEVDGTVGEQVVDSLGDLGRYIPPRMARGRARRRSPRDDQPASR